MLNPVSQAGLLDVTHLSDPPLVSVLLGEGELPVYRAVKVVFVVDELIRSTALLSEPGL